jgi:hypothetical protein
MAGTLPLLHKQEGRLIREELRRRSTGNSQSLAQFAIAFASENPINRIALTRAFNAVVARHSALRTIVVPSPRHNETVRQMQLQTFARTGMYIPGLYEQRPIEHAEVELAERAWSGDAGELDSLAREECARSLDLSTPPALRAMVISGAGKELVIVNLSHLLLDLWAVTLLHREVAYAYGAFVSGVPLELRPVLQHHDLVVDEIAMLQSAESKQHLAYWTAHYDALGDALINASELPFVSRTPGPPKYKILRVTLSEEETRQAYQACRGTPDYAFWRTMYGVALGILVNRTRVAFTANFLNRRRPGAVSALAWCAHTHMLAVHAPWPLPWSAVWRQVRDGVREAQAHEEYSKDTLAQRLGRMIGFTNTHLSFDLLPGYSHYDAPLQPVAVPGVVRPADLSVSVRHVNHTYTLWITFNSGRYEAEGVHDLMTLLRDTIRACAAQPAATVGDIVRVVRQWRRNGAVAVGDVPATRGVDEL